LSRILVTGGCGYVGTALVDKLCYLGYKIDIYDNLWFGNPGFDNDLVSVIEGDLRNIDALNLSDYELIYHLGGIANDPTGDLNPRLTWECNALATSFLVEKAVKSGVPRFIFASSGSVYGIQNTSVVDEHCQLIPLTEYNKSKMVTERVLMSYSEQIAVQILRPATVSGFSRNFRRDVVVNIFSSDAIESGKITVLGGSQMRPHIHIDDMVSAYIFMLENPDLLGVFNVGFENISILDLANKVADKFGVEIVIKNSNDPRSYKLNSDKILKAGFRPSFKVVDAIDDIKNAFESGRLVFTDNQRRLQWMKEKGFGHE